MALARAAIDAREWQTAREALEGLVRSQPSERVCLLMAEIEGAEHGDEGRVRGWLARAINAPRDPTWVADGRIFESWAPISPVSGRIDAFEWKVAGEPLSASRMPQIDAWPETAVPVAIGVQPEAAKEIEAEAATYEAPPVEIADVVDAPAGPDEAADGPDRPADGTGGEEAIDAAPDETDIGAPQPAAPEAETPDSVPADAGPEETEAEPKAVAPAATDGESEPEPKPKPAEMAMPRVPDDPGPEPQDEIEKPRRFRLFGSSA
jgi:HemY protein